MCKMIITVESETSGTVLKTSEVNTPAEAGELITQYTAVMDVLPPGAVISIRRAKAE